MPVIDPSGIEFIENVVKVNRVSKVVAGGKRFSFSALVVVGNGRGLVGVGLGKAPAVPDAIRKGTEAAKKRLISIPLKGTTIPHEVNLKYQGSRVILRPAAPGTGVIAGGPVRAVVQAAGIKDILTKTLGSQNPINVVYSTIKALRFIEDLGKADALREGKPYVSSYEKREELSNEFVGA